ncbi:MAG: efflux RND transporter periplasmic adaptor subunit [Bacteroidota bacterium]|nr:efflux RND transporter periplasmic adaptor subunit [Bacteroidota bacterium]
MKKAILLPGLFLFLIACNSPEGEDKKAELAELKKQEAEIKTKIAALELELGRSDSSTVGVAVSVIPVKASVFKNYIDVQGRVDADENVTLSTGMPGTITKINVKVGDEVNKGQVLAETDSRALSQSMSDLQTNSDLVNQIYQKQKNLWDQKIGTEIQYLQAKTNKESMEKKMGALQEQIRMSKIISPINGTVDAVDIKLGQMVSPGMPSIRVINFSNLKVKADVAESYASKIRKGSEVIVYFPDMNDSVITKVNFVSRAISSASRTFSVEVLLDNKKEYHPNMVTRLKINDYQSGSPSITIPVRTIQKDEDGKSFVYVAENGAAKKCIVETGKQYSGQAEIISGLKENEMLVVLGYDLINEGDKISYTK